LLKECDLEVKMTNGSTEVRSLLKDLSLAGALIVPKKKLLWMLGWGQDRPGAWATLVDHWKELGENPNNLHGVEVHDKIVLFANDKTPSAQPVTDWAA
jgi:hypothetical protein